MQFLICNIDSKDNVISETQLKANLYCLYCEHSKLNSSFRIFTNNNFIDVTISHLDVDDIEFEITYKDIKKEGGFKNQTISKNKILSLAMNEFLECFFESIKDNKFLSHLFY